MPDPKDNAKASGDVHPPEVEDRARDPAGTRPAAEGSDTTPPEGSQSRDLENEGRAGKGINQAGTLKDKDAPGTGGSGRS